MATSTRELKLENLQLFQDYQQSRDLQLRNRIMNLNFGLVRREAHYWVNQCNESYEDLLQVGCLGLLRAIERFDCTKGNAFSSFAMPYIRGEIQHYLRDRSTSIRIPRRWLEIYRQANGLIRSFRVEYNRQPTDLEIAQKLNISLQDWQEIKLAYDNREPVSLDTPVNGDEDGQTSLGDLVPDHHYRSFQLAQEDQLRLQSALGELEDRTRHVLEFVFLQDLTHKQVADRLGISVVTVSRQVKKGLSFLKESMTKEIF
jgi:RNA polymerase sigma-B factor